MNEAELEKRYKYLLIEYCRICEEISKLEKEANNMYIQLNEIERLMTSTQISECNKTYKEELDHEK